MPDGRAADLGRGKTVAQERGQEDHRPLHALRLVDRHDSNHVGVGVLVVLPPLRIGGFGTVPEKLAERVVLVGGLGVVMDRFVVGDDLAELPEVEEDDLAAPVRHPFLADAGVFEKREKDALEGVHSPPPLRGVPDGRPGPGGLGHRPPQRARFESEVGASPRPFDRRFVHAVAVRHEVEELPRGLGLRLAEQIRHAGDDVRNPRRFECRGDRCAVLFHAAEQDRHVGPRQTAFGVAVPERHAVQRPRRRRNVLGLFLRCAERERRHVAALGGLRAGRRHRLLQPFVVLFDEGARRVDDPRAGAEVLVEPDPIDIGIPIAEREDVPDVAARHW